MFRPFAVWLPHSEFRGENCLKKSKPCFHLPIQCRCIPVINALLLSATFETYAGLFEFLAEHIRNRALIVVKEMELAAAGAQPEKNLPPGIFF